MMRAILYVNAPFKIPYNDISLNFTLIGVGLPLFEKCKGLADVVFIMFPSCSQLDGGTQFY